MLQPQTSTTESSEAEGDKTPPTTSNHSADDTTSGDTEFLGTEPIDFVLTLPTCCQKDWVVKRLAAYQTAVVTFAEVCLSSRGDGGKKSLTEIEWEAIQATEGLTRAVPNEQVVYKWIMERS